MRILVFSDTHGMWVWLAAALEQAGPADYIIHLGDGADDYARLISTQYAGRCANVRGNCDFDHSLPIKRMIEIEGHNIFFTHGHEYGVKIGTDRLVSVARDAGADICLFGHTHIPVSTCVDGIHLLNPGSLAYCRNGVRTFGYVDILPSGVLTGHMTLK